MGNSQQDLGSAQNRRICISTCIPSCKNGVGGGKDDQNISTSSYYNIDVSPIRNHFANRINSP